MGVEMRAIVSVLVFMFLMMAMAFYAISVFSSGDDPEGVVQDPSDSDGWVYGRIEHLHDLIAPNQYFMLLRGHPGQPVPRITGGYATTDIYVVVRLRGVDVPRELQHSQERHRPHQWILNERKKWDAAMRYVWNVTEPTRTFRAYDLKVIDESGDKVLEGDLEVWLGGQWQNLAYLLMNDGHARPIQSDGTEWDWGMATVPLVNPSIPK